jgi:hypothetical protein
MPHVAQEALPLVRNYPMAIPQAQVYFADAQGHATTRIKRLTRKPLRMAHALERGATEADCNSSWHVLSLHLLHN